jgi:response regulator RpfG family c-di-GMP phosphodiesterase
MCALTGQETPRASIMAVDDNPANLKLLEDMLHEHGYEVRSFPRGRLALAAVDREPPDLILLDISMPEMNGYEVCEHLKSSRRHSGIPVIFLSAQNTIEDKVRGFRSGGVDYISKPFQFEEVQARVEAHIKLRRAQQAEHNLLEKTLGGAVRALWELVQLASPMLSLRSRSIRDMVQWITKRTEIEDAWQYELAATLCLVGCITLPDDIVERAYHGEALQPEEAQMFRAHPESGSRLLSSVPRMEIVAEMIRGQLDPESAAVPERARRGARMLHLALEVDRRIRRGATSPTVAAELKLSRRFEGAMLDALAGYSPIQMEFELRRLPIHQLRPDMVLEKDVLDGNLVIFKAGTVLTATWVERLKNFALMRRLEKLVEVRVPACGIVHQPENAAQGTEND